MQPESNIAEPALASETKIQGKIKLNRKSVILTVSILGILFLSLYHLTLYPAPWFDEGSHLHVPKTLLRFGVYADYSSEGFRYYGPTIGVGPTVMLPIAAIFKVTGMGLLQARVAMVVYLLAAIFALFKLAQHLGGSRLAWVAMALLISSRGVALFEYGRQVLGEVPGLFFVAAGLWLWFSVWEKASWLRLTGVGLLLGLAMITKNQYLLVLAPTLLGAWIANLVYYRQTPQRVFLIPGIVAGSCFALWQIYMLMYLGPATIGENLAMFRTATAGAALVFSPELMKRSLSEILSLKVYLGWLIPVLIYSFILVLPRRRKVQPWSVIFILIAVNLVWYIVASISWLRYAFPALAFSSLFVARFFADLTGGFRWNWSEFWRALRNNAPKFPRLALNGALLLWLIAMIALPLAQTTRDIVGAASNGAPEMAAYLNEHAPLGSLIETWEPEMGFFTNHNYHFPPPLLLNSAVGQVWLGGEPVDRQYTFIQDEQPDYVLVGSFARWVNLYPPEMLAEDYHLLAEAGTYQLYQREN